MKSLLVEHLMKSLLVEHLMQSLLVGHLMHNYKNLSTVASHSGGGGGERARKKMFTMTLGRPEWYIAKIIH